MIEKLLALIKSLFKKKEPEIIDAPKPPVEEPLEIHKEADLKLLQIRRFKSGVDWTLGHFILYDNNLPIFTGFTLEPAGADEIRSGLDRRIPQGRYNAIFEYSPKFSPKYNGRLVPVLFNEQVSKNRRILIHAGNKGLDTEGCILVGNTWADNCVYNSVATLTTLLDKLKDEPFTVEIINGGV